MKNRFITLSLITVVGLQFGCGEKKDEKRQDQFIPVASLIESQVSHIDTSLYPIIKVIFRDTLTNDTEYIRREDFRAIARDFLEIPELSKKKFTEENIPGPTDNLSTISYRPIDPDKEEIQKVDIIIDPALTGMGNNVIKSIFVDKTFTNKDSAVGKKMLWRIDHSFQVTTFKQLKGQPETTETYRVIWNEDEYQ